MDASQLAYFPANAQVICLGREGQDCTNVVVVQPGNTCEDIAGPAGISFETLRANNPNINEYCTNLYPGEVCQLICIVRVLAADHGFLGSLCAKVQLSVVFSV